MLKNTNSNNNIITREHISTIANAKDSARDSAKGHGGGQQHKTSQKKNHNNNITTTQRVRTAT